MSATIVDLNQYRQVREQIIQDALDCPDYLDEIREINRIIQELEEEIACILGSIYWY